MGLTATGTTVLVATMSVGVVGSYLSSESSDILVETPEDVHGHTTTTDSGATATPVHNSRVGSSWVTGNSPTLSAPSTSLLASNATSDSRPTVASGTGAVGVGAVMATL